MNEVLNAILTRRSVRSYKPDPVPQEALERILTAGQYAATGMNRQSPIILAVTNKAMRDKLSAMNAEIMGSSGDPFYGAPVVLVVLVGNLMLAAHAEGLASCWIHRAKDEFESEEGKAILKELGIEGDWEGIGHCILGYADGEPKPAAPRKPDYVHYIR